MRGAIEPPREFASLAEGLPSVYRRDEFTTHLVGALDAVLAPVFLTLDNLDAYLDPRLAPDDFLPWLGGWLGLTLNERWTDDQRRVLIERAVELYLWRGTARGIADAVEVYLGVRPEIVDSGGVAWSAQPNGAIPGRAEPELVVRIATDAGGVDLDVVERIVADAKPAHVPHRVEVAAPARRTRAARGEEAS